MRAAALICAGFLVGGYFDACAAIVDYDAASIALYEEDRARHRVSAVRVG